MVLELGLSLVKDWFPKLDRLLESAPLIVVDHGRVLTDRTPQERVDLSDVMAAAREHHGLERLEQIEYAVERSGGLSIIPAIRG